MHPDDAMGRTRDLDTGRVTLEKLDRKTRDAIAPYRIHLVEDGPTPPSDNLAKHQGKQAPHEPAPPAHVAQRTMRYMRWLAKKWVKKRGIA